MRCYRIIGKRRERESQDTNMSKTIFFLLLSPTPSASIRHMDNSLVFFFFYKGKLEHLLKPSALRRGPPWWTHVGWITSAGSSSWSHVVPSPRHERYYRHYLRGFYWRSPSPFPKVVGVTRDRKKTRSHSTGPLGIQMPKKRALGQLGDHELSSPRQNVSPATPLPAARPSVG
jgi:hypothetical protein